MRIALVSGDGLPVSGLLTSFRNAMLLGVEKRLVTLPIEADLGYSWRPDKPAFFPDGPSEPERSDTFTTPSARFPDFLSDGVAAGDWVHLRRVAAGAEPSTEATHALATRVREAYRHYFRHWWQSSGIDWVVAINLTLSDATPVTGALYRAADDVFGNRATGGVVVWDHDLFGSCAVWDEDGTRYYPVRPTPIVELPPRRRYVRWAAVSESLMAEARTYPTEQEPVLLPNILPGAIDPVLDRHHHEFRAQHAIDDGAPVHLNPVRVFRVKGVTLALDAFATMLKVTADESSPMPVMLVFGNLGEDPAYAAEALARAAELGIEDSVRFLDGVPLATYRDADGRWRLDETDLLRLSKVTGGGVLFTPCTSDVETIGLGPALAAVAGVPCVVTEYDAFEQSYGRSFSATILPAATDAWGSLMVEYHAECVGAREDDGAVLGRLARNRSIVAERFPAEPWLSFLAGLDSPTVRKPTRADHCPGPQLDVVSLIPRDCLPVDTRIARLTGLRPDIGTGQMLRAVRRAGSLLPSRLTDRLWDLHLGVGPAYFVVGRPPLDERIGRTPTHWSARSPRETIQHDLWLLVVMSQLGDPVCWTSLQDGRLLNDIMPIRGDDREQTGHGSETNLEFHVEDAFDDLRCDTLGLLCLRNNQHAPSMVCDMSTVPIANSDRDVLAEPRFSITPDVEHARNAPGLGEVEVAILAPDGTLRLDPAYTRARPGDTEAAAALRRLTIAVHSSLIDVSLSPGDLLVIDNHRAVHGRRAFRASHDGNDRWLRKATVTRDLRRSRFRRDSPDARAISTVGPKGIPCDQLNTSSQRRT